MSNYIPSLCDICTAPVHITDPFKLAMHDSDGRTTRTGRTGARTNGRTSNTMTALSRSQSISIFNYNRPAVIVSQRPEHTAHKKQWNPFFWIFTTVPGDPNVLDPNDPTIPELLKIFAVPVMRTSDDGQSATATVPPVKTSPLFPDPSPVSGDRPHWVILLKFQLDGHTVDADTPLFTLGPDAKAARVDLEWMSECQRVTAGRVRCWIKETSTDKKLEQINDLKTYFRNRGKVASGLPPMIEGENATPSTGSPSLTHAEPTTPVSPECTTGKKRITSAWSIRLPRQEWWRKTVNSVRRLS